MGVKFRDLLGGNLVEYVIPAAVVGLVFGLGLYSLAANGTLANFLAGSTGTTVPGDGMMVIGGTSGNISNLINENNPSNTPVNPVTPANSPTNTPTNSPVSTTPTTAQTCSGGYCDITVGSFSLTGVPENPANLIESTGVPIYTDYIGALIQQVYDQLKDDGVPTSDPLMTQISHLANYIQMEGPANSLANMQKDSESMCTPPTPYFMCSGAAANLDQSVMTVNGDLDAIKNMASSYSSQQNIQDAIKLIDILGNEALNINSSLKNIVENVSSDADLSNIKPGVASTATDLRGDIIAAVGTSGT